MAKFLLLWELDPAKVPISPQERGTTWSRLLDMVEQDLKKGALKDWGGFVGEINGYAVAEGTEVEIDNLVQQYIPFVCFKVHPITSLSQMNEVTKALSK